MLLPRCKCKVILLSFVAKRHEKQQIYKFIDKNKNDKIPKKKKRKPNNEEKKLNVELIAIDLLAVFILDRNKYMI